MFTKNIINLKAFLIFYIDFSFSAAALAAPAASRRIALLVGVADYLDGSILKLKTSRRDAQDMAITLQSLAWDKVIVLTDDADARSPSFPTRGNIEKQAALISELVGKNDTILLFFSGHGANQQGEDLFLPVDADLSRLKETSVSIQSIVKRFTDKGISKVILAVDACRETLSQTKGLSVTGISGSNDEAAGQNQAGSPAVGIYATQKGWYSFEDSDGRNGVFTKFLIEGLKGGALSPAKGGSITSPEPVTSGDLLAWLPQAVGDYALERGIRQKPVIILRSDNDSLNAIVLGRGLRQVPQPSATALPASIIENIDEITEDDMVFIRGGSFKMGNVFKQGQANERPAHNVTLSGFFMKRTKISSSELATVLNWAMESKKLFFKGGKLYAEGNTRQYLFDFNLEYVPCEYSNGFFKGYGNGIPVSHNSWYLCCAYANWLSEMNGFQPPYDITNWRCDPSQDGYRLPTDAEWEYAARNGGKDIRYPWGNEVPGKGMKPVANLKDESMQKSGSSHAGAHFIGYEDGVVWQSEPAKFAPSELGLFDIFGNMMEFVNDAYYNYTMKAETNPSHSSGSQRIIRGAGYDTPKVDFLPTVFTRFESDPFSYAGFRLVRKAP